jgi:GR25 family glycosyltransferase involved in LPS biosynthesis
MPEQSSAYHGTYINLDRSQERRQRFETDLARLSLASRYSRFPAIDGRTLPKGHSPLSPGQLGCFHSHVWALKEAKSLGVPVHILEDDALLCEHTEPVIADAIAARLFDHFDIVFTDTLLDCELALLKGMKDAYDKTAGTGSRPLRISVFQILDLSRRNFSCLTSYIVSARSIDRILTLYRQELALGPRVPVDIFIRDLAHTGKLRAGCIFPFVTGLALKDIAGSTIEERGDTPIKPAVMVLAALRYSFFLGRDLGFAKREMDAATQRGRAAADPHRELILQAIDYVMSPDFEAF